MTFQFEIKLKGKAPAILNFPTWRLVESELHKFIQHDDTEWVRFSNMNLETMRLDRDLSEAEALIALLDPPGYAKRVRELEAEGLTTSDAQAAADAELMIAQ